MQSVDANEIITGLWMGSAPPVGRTLARAGFHVLALCAEEYQPSAEAYPSVEIARTSLVDDGSPLTFMQLDEVLDVSRGLAETVRKGRCVLVTCVQGRNRSGLVTAMTLSRLTGMSGTDAVWAVRARRCSLHGPALTNRHYVEAMRVVPSRRVAS